MKTSLSGARVSTSSCISRALRTSTRSTPRGVARTTGPATASPGALRRSRRRDREAHAAGAPIADEAHRIDVFERRSRADQEPDVRRACAAPRVAASSATIVSASRSRPAPNSPQAWLPDAGPSTRTPRGAISRHSPASPSSPTSADSSPARARSARRSRGTTSSGDRSQDRCASRAMTSADAGAMTTSFAQRASSMCPIAASAPIRPRDSCAPDNRRAPETSAA